MPKEKVKRSKVSQTDMRDSERLMKKAINHVSLTRVQALQVTRKMWNRDLNVSTICEIMTT